VARSAARRPAEGYDPRRLRPMDGGQPLRRPAPVPPPGPARPRPRAVPRPQPRRWYERSDLRVLPPLTALGLFILVLFLILMGVRWERLHPVEEVLPPPVAMAADGEHPQLIAHAGGAVFGYRLTSSREAMDLAYANGFRFMELDFSMTSDYQIVLLHDWEGTANRLLGSPGVRTLDQFLSDRAMAGLTLLDLAGLEDWLEAHPDVSIITDTKSEANYTFLEFLYGRSETMADRFIPQAYSYEEYTQIKELGYDRIILTLYKIQTDPDTLAAFAAQEHPWAVTIPWERLNDQLMSKLSATGVSIYTHSVNSVDTFEAWKDKGLTGLYTDYFTPNRWLYNETGGVPAEGTETPLPQVTTGENQSDT